MGAMRKLTVQVPADLLRRAQKSTGSGVTDTVRRGLEMVAAAKTYDELRRMRGRVNFSISLPRLREDRV